MISDKCALGIGELDGLLKGGIPRRSLVLLAGNPGTGKTILSTKFLQFGARNGEKGVYVSFAEDRKDYFKNMLTLGMDMRSLEEKGLFKFVDFALVDKEAIEKALDIIVETITEIGARRLVIDPLSSITQSIGQESARAFLHSILGKLVKNLGVTTIVIGEIPYGESKTVGGAAAEFIADGVIVLRHTRKGNVEKNEIEIAKMRGVPIERSAFEYMIDEKLGGIGVIVLPQKSDIDSAPIEKVTLGVEGLDRMMSGGVYRGSVTLVEGAGGIGKTTLCLQALIANARKGETTLFLSFEEPVGQIKRTLEGLGIEYQSLSDRFFIECYVPETLTPLHYYKMLREILEAHNPSVIALDSLSAIAHSLTDEDYMTFMRYLQLLCKEKRISAILTSTYGTEKQKTSSGVSTFADNIIVMRYELKDLAREIVIIKTRGSPHEKKATTFDITAQGLVVHD